MLVQELTKINTEGKAELFTVEDFLSYEECKYLIRKIEESNQPSLVTSENDEGQARAEDFRTSSSCYMNSEDDFLKELEKRMRLILPEETVFDEGIQGQKYEVGQFFKTHHDYFDPAQPSLYKKHTEGRGGQRSWTFMIYLNDVYEGGETEFANLGIKLSPIRGMAVIWRNLYSDGRGNPNTLHQGLPPISNTKYIITKWYREGEKIVTPVKAPVPPIGKGTFTSHDDIPTFTSLGFEVRDIPQRTFNLIKEAYALLLPTIKTETWEGKETFIKSDRGESTEFLNFEQLPEVRRLIHEQLQPIHEEWAGTRLEPTFIYGIRSYKDGAILAAHKDRIATHHISSIILVDESTRQDWPLDIQDHQGNWHKVVIRPGQMILYESAACEHARLQPFEGEYFRNFFVHYKLVDFIYEPN